MNDEERLRQQMAQIGVRYLTRTLGELRRIRELITEVESGSPTALKELERAAHKIHGSGAMFGFQEVSDRAREVEHLAGHLSDGDGPEHLHGLPPEELRRQLSASVAQLDQVTRATAQTMGIEADAG